jgi:hypothetical protein
MTDVAQGHERTFEESSMKKVLVGTCVLAMTAFGVTNASADPVETARAGAFGINLSLAGTQLVDQMPSVSSVFPPGSSEEEDVATIPAGSLALEGVGIQQAETSGESTITPALVPDGGGGTGDPLGGTGDLLGGFGLGDLLGGGDGSGTGVGGIGGPDDNDIEIPAVNARGFSSINLTGVVIDEGAGGTGDPLGSGELGGIGEILPLDDLLSLTGSAGTFQTQQVDDLIGGGVTGGELTEIVFEALLRLGVVESEAVAVCTGNEVRFDVASRLVDTQGATLDLDALLTDVIGSVLDLTDTLAPGLIETRQGEVSTTDDGGVSINALRIVVGEDLGGDIIPGTGDIVPGTGDIVPGTEEIVPGTGDIVPGTGDIVPGTGDIVPGTEQIVPAEGLLDVVLAHSEVGGTICAQQAAPPALVPAGDDRTLPVTGGALGVLPAVLGLGLAGGALAAGRLALRSRRENTL